MHFTKSFMLLAAITSGALARPSPVERRQAYGAPSPSASSPSASSSSSPSGGGWTGSPPNGDYSQEGFGQMTSGTGGSGVTYGGNTGNPWGSNIIEISEESAPMYKNVAQFKGQNSDTWTVVFWNKIGPDGKMDGWYGNNALTLTMNPGDTKYVAFQDDSQGGWSAAQGDTVPTEDNGGYSGTWGEFDFKSDGNGGWSGFDVSAIPPQNAGTEVQGMQICQATGGNVCSSITGDAAVVDNAYTTAQTAAGGIGANIPGNGAPMRLAVVIDYQG